MYYVAVDTISGWTDQLQVNFTIISYTTNLNEVKPVYVHISCTHNMHSRTKLKIICCKTWSIKWLKTDKNSPSAIGSDRKCFNVLAFTRRSDLPARAQLKAPLVPGTDYVWTEMVVIGTATRKIFYVSKMEGSTWKQKRKWDQINFISGEKYHQFMVTADRGYLNLMIASSSRKLMLGSVKLVLIFKSTKICTHWH